MSNHKRILESPDGNIGTPKVSKMQNNTFPSTYTNNQAACTDDNSNKNDIVTAVRLAVAAEFEIFKTENFAPIVKDVNIIKGDIKSMKSDRESDRIRINILERELKQRNIIFSKLPKTDDIEKSIVDLCKETLGITNVYIDKVVVLRTNENDNSSTTLAVFGSQKTADHIIRNAKKLKHTGIFVSRDLGQDDREARNLLLLIRKLIKAKDNSQMVKVYGNKIVINDVKLYLTKDHLENKQTKINGKQFLLERFGIDFDEINKQ